MKVAVLIPLHNNARFIGAAIASLRAQSRPPDRIIVDDDGSTDGSLNALMAGAEEPAPVSPAGSIMVKGMRVAAAERIETQTDIVIVPAAGPHATLNRAVALADDCDYLAILRSEDCYHPRRLERCLAYLEEHPEIDLVCTRLRLIDPDGKSLPADAPRARWFAAAWSYSASIDDSDALNFAEWLGLANFAGTPSNFFARASYLREHPFHDYPVAYDYYALIMAALDNKLGVIDAELLDHRVQKGQAEGVGAEPCVRELLRLNVDLMRGLAGRLGREPALRTAFSRYLRALWSNVSGVRADLLNLILCEALSLGSEAGLSELIARLLREQHPDTAEYPNRSVAGAHVAGSSGVPAGLADKFFQLKTRLSGVRADARPWLEYRQLQEALLGSRWYALGRLLGRVRGISDAGGQTAPEKLATLRERIASSRWLRLGHRLGLSSATKLLALSGSSAPAD